MRITVVPQAAKLLWITPNATEQIERAGRTCYRSEDKIADGSAGAFVRKILGHGHDSVIEHAVASILFVTDRGVSHELVRHRLASYCQESTRYVNYGKRQGLHVIEPLGLNEDQSAAWYSGVLQAAAAYERMLAEGCGLDQARDCLPTCVKTEIVMTANFRTWRHVIAQRTSRRAHPKIQALLALASAELHAACPEVFP